MPVKQSSANGIVVELSEGSRNWNSVGILCEMFPNMTDAIQLRNDQFILKVKMH